MKPAWLISVLVLLIALGGIYGFKGAIQNCNPQYSPDGSPRRSDFDRHAAWNWKPSPVWLTSYMLAKVDYGITLTRSGYLFRKEADRTRYIAGSVAVGVVMGLTAYVVFVLLYARASRNAEKQ